MLASSTRRQAWLIRPAVPCTLSLPCSSYKSRFRVTGTGKVLYARPGHVHKRFSKSKRQVGGQGGGPRRPSRGRARCLGPEHAALPSATELGPGHVRHSRPTRHNCPSPNSRISHHAPTPPECSCLTSASTRRSRRAMPRQSRNSASSCASSRPAACSLLRPGPASRNPWSLHFLHLWLRSHSQAHTTTDSTHESTKVRSGHTVDIQGAAGGQGG